MMRPATGQSRHAFAARRPCWAARQGWQTHQRFDFVTVLYLVGVKVFFIVKVLFCIVNLVGATVMARMQSLRRASDRWKVRRGD